MKLVKFPATLILLLDINGICASYYANAEKHVRKAFPDQKIGINTSPNFERFYSWFTNGEKQEKSAFIQLYQEELGLKDIFSRFFASSVDWNEPWKQFALTLQKVARTRGYLNDEAKLVLLSTMIEEYKFSGLINLLKSIKSCFPIDGPEKGRWNQLFKKFYNQLASSNSHLIERVINSTWFQKGGLEAKNIKPFPKKQLVEMVYRHGKETTVRFLIKAIFILDFDLEASLEECALPELLRLFLKNIYMLVVRELSDDSVAKAFVKTAVQEDHDLGIILAFINAVPTGLILPGEKGNFQRLYDYLEAVNHLIDLPPDRSYDFRMRLCLNAGVYCNPFTVDTSTLANLRRYIHHQAVPINELSTLRNPFFYELLKKQPLLAAVVVCQETIRDSLLAAPIVPIAYGLQGLVRLFIERHRDKLELHWTQDIYMRMVKSPIQFAWDWIEGRGFQKRNILEASPLTMNSIKEWEFLFAPEFKEPPQK